MVNRAVVSSFFASWGVQDVEWSLEHLHDDVVYESHVDAPELPYVRVTRGKESCRDAMFSILRDFDYLKYDSTIISVRGNTVRARVEFRYRHRPTGEVLEGSRRVVFKLKDGLIVRIDSYHDGKLFEAFMRLMKHRVDTNQIVRGPVLPRQEKHGST
jgi:ketosteroid isomerase-like protein